MTEELSCLLSSAIPAKTRITGKLAVELLSTMAILSLVENVLTYLKNNLQINDPINRPSARKILQDLYQKTTFANFKKFEGPFAGLDSGFLGNLLRLYRPFLKPFLIDYVIPKDSRYFDIAFLLLYTIIDTAVVAPLSVARTMQQTEGRAKLSTITAMMEAGLLHNPQALDAKAILKVLINSQKSTQNANLTMQKALRISGFLKDMPALSIAGLTQKVKGLTTLETFQKAGARGLFTRYDIALLRQLSFNAFMLNIDSIGCELFGAKQLTPSQKFATSFACSTVNTVLTQVIDCAYTRATKTGATSEEIKHALRKAFHEAFCTGKGGFINMFGLACGVRIILLLPAMLAFNHANDRTSLAKAEFSALAP